MEDKQVNREVATLMLDQVGMVVTAVSDGQQALQLIEQRPFDVVPMDVQLPGMDGLGRDALPRITRWSGHRALGAAGHA